MRVRFPLVSLVFTSMVLAGVACGFPDVTYSADEPDTADAGDNRSAMEPTEAVNEPPVPSAQASVPGESPAAPSATMAPTVNAPPDASDGSDGVKRDAGSANETNGPVRDPSVQDAATAPPTPAPTTTATSTGTTPPPPPPPPAPTCDPNADFAEENKDRNCDGAITKELPHGITCNSLSDCTQGFDGDPACGATAAYNVCRKVIGLLGSVLCERDHTEVRTQRCR